MAGAGRQSRVGPGRLPRASSILRPTCRRSRSRRIPTTSCSSSSPTSTAVLPAVEAAAAATFWRAAWLADGNATAVGAAQAALDAAVTPARAEVILTRYQPVNFAATAARPDARLADVAGVPRVRARCPAPSPTTLAPPRRESAARRAEADAPARPVRVPRLPGSEPPLVVAGGPVPTRCSPDRIRRRRRGDQIRHDDDGRLVVPDGCTGSPTSPAPSASGMALRVPLTAAQAQRGFDRVLVVGLRLNADVESAQARARDAAPAPRLRPVPGWRSCRRARRPTTPRPPTPARPRHDDPDATFDDLPAPLFTPAAGSARQARRPVAGRVPRPRPGASSQHVHGAGDDRPARRPRDEHRPVAGDARLLDGDDAGAGVPADGIDADAPVLHALRARRGRVPALRIGSQPYGILPATALSRAAWLHSATFAGGARSSPCCRSCARLHAAADGARSRLARGIPSSAIAHVGKPRRSARAAARHPRPPPGLGRVGAPLRARASSRCSTA